MMGSARLVERVRARGAAAQVAAGARVAARGVKAIWRTPTTTHTHKRTIANLILRTLTRMEEMGGGVGLAIVFFRTRLLVEMRTRAIHSQISPLRRPQRTCIAFIHMAPHRPLPLPVRLHQGTQRAQGLGTTSLLLHLVHLSANPSRAREIRSRRS